MKKLSAFTLTETLITIGIIGVVATLTLPNITSRYKSRVLSTQIQDVYNKIASAAVNTKTESRVDFLSDTYLGDDSAANLRPFFANNFKIANDCGTDGNNKTVCFAATYKNASGTAFTPTLDGYCVTISSGASICLDTMSSGENGVATVTIDVNGRKAPNTQGKDFFVFNLSADGTLGGGDIDSIVNSGFQVSE